MARIRTIKPEFPHSESMGKVSRDARLTFILLWTIADDHGRLRGNSRMLASLLFPYDDDAPKQIDKWLDMLEREGCVVRYQAEGSAYIQILNWQGHQRVDKPSQSRIPEPSEESRTFASVREDSCEDQRTKDQGPKEQRTKKGARAASVALDDLSVDHVAAWLAEKRSTGKYVQHDEHFILEFFKTYCQSKGKTYADYVAGYRGAFEWDRCQPRTGGSGQPQHQLRAGPAPLGQAVYDRRDPATRARDIGEDLIARRRAARLSTVADRPAEGQPAGPGRTDAAALPDLREPEVVRRQGGDDGVPGRDVPAGPG